MFAEKTITGVLMCSYFVFSHNVKEISVMFQHAIASTYAKALKGFLDVRMKEMVLCFVAPIWPLQTFSSLVMLRTFLSWQNTGSTTFKGESLSSYLATVLNLYLGRDRLSPRCQPSNGGGVYKVYFVSYYFPDIFDIKINNLPESYM